MLSRLAQVDQTMVSLRVQDILKPSPMYDSFHRALANAYHPIKNPNGIISLGIAENTLMYSELAKFLNNNMTITEDLFGYGANSPGVSSLMDGLLRLYNSETFSPVVRVEPKHVALTSGASGLLDSLFWSLCDEGDGVLIGKPQYGGFANDMSIKAKCKLVAVSLKGIDPFSKDALSRFEEELLKAKNEGTKVRALVLCTPHNPLGQYCP